MLFSEITGFDDIKKVLLNAANSGHVAHAQLFAGREGTPNLALALAFATYINCTDRQPHDACGQCASCAKYNKLIHPDLHTIFPVATNKTVTKDPVSEKFLPQFRQFVKQMPYGTVRDWADFFGAENKQLNISVEEGRNIIRRLTLKAYEAEYKVLLIWLPEFMNIQAANAILKILEEPPEKTLFFLVSNQPDKLLPTILSRTQIVNVRPFENEEIVTYLQQHHGTGAQEAVQAAQLAEGNLNEAIRLLSETTGNYHQFFTDWMRLCLRRRIPEIMDKNEEFQKLGREGQKSLFQYALAMIRQAFLYRLGSTGLVKLPPEELGFIEKFSPFVTENNVELFFTYLNDAYYHIERNGSGKIIFLDTSLQVSRCLNQA